MKTFVIFLLFGCCCNIYVKALSFPGPRVYVVTPASRPLQKNEDKPEPFFYHKWMDGWRRMDSALNDTTTTSTTTSVPKVKTPDLIFAEFESDGSMQKSIRKLLEKEKIKHTSTMSPIYVPDDEDKKVTRVVNYGLPVKLNNAEEVNEISTAKSPYSFMFNNDDYNMAPPAPVYLPSTKESTTISSTTTTTTQNPINVESIWHIIDNEKLNQYSGHWQEESFDDQDSEEAANGNIGDNDNENPDHDQKDNEDPKGSSEEVTIDENFALPGFAKNPGSGAENESRAIRTENAIRFPYVNLKPFQVKSSKKSINNFSTGKNNNNLLTNLDQFTDLKNPVRGEAQDIVPSGLQIDRYNPAQPYLPQPTYGNKVSKQSSPAVAPQRATANLVPPPPPPPPKITGNDFPAPITYDSFPPYPPSGSDFSGAAAPPIPSVTTSLKAPDMSDGLDASSDSGDNDDGLPMDLGYRYKPPSIPNDSDSNPMINMGYQYKPPSAPLPQFIPTIPPPSSKPFAGYSYNKPIIPHDVDSMPMNDKPDIQVYHYSKPELPKPEMDHMPSSYDSLPTYGHDDSPPYGHDSDHHGDYPELIFNKPHNDLKGGDIKDEMGMMPPPPPKDTKDMAYGPPPSDHGFPVDFPTDFKFHHDFDDSDHDHYHYHHPTTTTTTEMPRVNRFSYYYLGKKLYYLPLYFSVYFIIYVGALIIKAVLRHKIVYPNSWRPNDTTASFFSKRSVDEFMSHENLHDVTSRVTRAIAKAAEKYMNSKDKTK